MANREMRRSPFVTKLLQNAGIPVDDEKDDDWPRLLTMCTQIIQKAHRQGTINNAHLAVFGGSMIVYVIEQAPEADRGRIFDEFVAELRTQVVPK